MSVIERNNVHLQGSGERAMVFAHSFGCDQNMWRFVTPEFEKDFRVVLFDHVGAGGSDLSAYDPRKYSTLSGYADDVVEIGNELSLKDAVFVGHSVSAMIGVLASLKAPTIMGNPDRPELGEELTNSFCRTDPEIAKAFARVTFKSDNRADLPKVSVPTLILQCKEDIIASMQVGEFVHRQIPGSEMVVLNATGHCPNLSAPKEVVSAMQTFV